MQSIFFYRFYEDEEPGSRCTGSLDKKEASTPRNRAVINLQYLPAISTFQGIGGKVLPLIKSLSNGINNQTLDIFSIMTATDKENLQAVRPKINHIALAVTDLSESEQFYREIVGLEQIPEPFKEGRHAWFDLGGAELHIIKAAGKRREHIRSTHLCVCVDDLDAFVKKLTSYNVVFYDSNENRGGINIRPDGIRQIFFTDPDGYWIEVNDDF